MRRHDGLRASSLEAGGVSTAVQLVERYPPTDASLTFIAILIPLTSVAAAAPAAQMVSGSMVLRQWRWRRQFVMQ